MKTSAREPSPPAARARRSGQEGVGWDALVAVVLGAGLLTAGWLDVSAYRAGIGKPLVTFRLVTLRGDTRIGEDEFFHDGATMVRLANVGTTETNPGGSFRHALGPLDTVEIWTERTQAQLDFELVIPFEDQEVTVACNGQTIDQIHASKTLLQRSYPITLHGGPNEVTIRFERYNHHGVEFENDDTRPIAGTFRALNLFIP